MEENQEKTQEVQAVQAKPKSILLKSEKSADKSFQLSIWKNSYGIRVNIKKFARDPDGHINYFKKANQMTFSVEEFENFKNWIKTIRKKK